MEGFFKKFDEELEELNKDLEKLYQTEFYQDVSLYMLKKIYKEEND